jgi:hypothetical protein
MCLGPFKKGRRRRIGPKNKDKPYESSLDLASPLSTENWKV